MVLADNRTPCCLVPTQVLRHRHLCHRRVRAVALPSYHWGFPLDLSGLGWTGMHVAVPACPVKAQPGQCGCSNPELSLSSSLGFAANLSAGEAALLSTKGTFSIRYIRNSPEPPPLSP